jgi:hypothetical protein
METQSQPQLHQPGVSLSLDASLRIYQSQSFIFRIMFTYLYDRAQCLPKKRLWRQP